MAEILILLAFIATLAAVSIYLQSRKMNLSVVSRKILHIGAIAASAISVYMVPDLDLLYYTVLLLFPIVGIAVWKGFLKNPVNGRRSWGMVWYALIFAVLLAFFRESKPHLVYYVLMVLALADGFAALVGISFRIMPYRAGGDERTVAGSVMFFLTALIVLSSGAFFIGVSTGLTLVEILGVAFFITLVEASSSNGSDNLWVPLSLVYWLLILPDVAYTPAILVSAIALPFTAILAFRSKWLSSGGALVALLFGWFYVLSPAPSWVVIPLGFFVLGSLLSKLNADRHTGPARSSMQVLANGGVPAAFLAAFFVSGFDVFLVGFVCGFGAALSDTSSSEIGVKLSQRAYSIVGFKPYPAGLSGGVSAGGTIAGLVFAGIIALLALAVWGRFSWSYFYLFTGAAFAGNIADSLLGQFIQIKYFNEITHEWQDTRPDGVLFTQKGMKGITNDVVNLISTTFSGVLGYIIYTYCEKI